MDEMAAEVNGRFGVHQVVVLEPDVRAIRARTGMSQAVFAQAFGFSLNAVRDWERGRHRPRETTRHYLWVIHHSPEGVLAALAEAMAFVPCQQQKPDGDQANTAVQHNT